MPRLLAASVHSYSAGLLAEGDQVSLSADFRVSEGHLLDDVTGARHRLHPLAEKAIQGIAVGYAQVTDWLDSMERLGIDVNAGAEMIGFLNNIGGLRVRRSIKSRVKVLIENLKGLLFGIRIQTLTSRRDASIDGIGRAAILALYPFIALTVPVAILWYGAGLSGGTVLALFMITNFALWLSIVMHELAHAVLIARSDRKVAVLQRGLNLGILHRPLAYPRAVIGALLGPIVGAITSYAICAISAIIFNLETLREIGWLMVALHLASLLPAYGDGKVIWRKYQKSA